MLSGSEIVTLQNQISALFSLDDLRLIVREQFNVRLSDITNTAADIPHPSIFGRVLDYAMRRGRVVELLTAFDDERDNLDLSFFRTRIMEETWGYRPEDYVLMPVLQAEQIMINRIALRKKIRRISTGDRRILVITGDSLSGKSYSYQLVRHLKEMTGEFKDIFCDVVDSIYLSDGKLTGENLSISIADQVGLTVPEFTSDDQVSRWLKRFANLLKRHLQSEEKTYWLVIDHMNPDRVLIDATARDLIFQLAKRVYEDLTNLRLILIDFDQEELDTLKSIVDYNDRVDIDVIQPIDWEEDLKEFFELVYDFRHKVCAMPYSPEDIEHSIDTVFTQVDPQNDNLVRSLAQQAAAEARRIKNAIIDLVGAPAADPA